MQQAQTLSPDQAQLERDKTLAIVQRNLVLRQFQDLDPVAQLQMLGEAAGLLKLSSVAMSDKRRLINFVTALQPQGGDVAVTCSLILADWNSAPF